MESQSTKIIVYGEENLLAVYLNHNRTFPINSDLMIIEDGIWKSFINKEKYKLKEIANKSSKTWDWIIEKFYNDYNLHGSLGFGESLEKSDLAIRTIARENRFNRRILGKQFSEFYQSGCGAILFQSPSNIVYVYLVLPHSVDRNDRVKELYLRCFVAHGLYQIFKTVVGIATERYQQGKGDSFDLIYSHQEKWTDECQSRMEAIQNELGYFKNPVEKKISEDEYPLC